MGVAELTKTRIDAAWRHRDGTKRILRDHRVRGLYLGIRAQSATWFFEFRLPGVHPEKGGRWPTTTLKLGRLTTDFHLEEARKAALAAKAKVVVGIDPAAERKGAIGAQLADTAAQVRTVATLVEAYTQARSQRWRPATARAFKGDLREIVDALGAVPIHNVTRRMLAAFLRDFVDRKAAEGYRGTRVERLRMLLGSLFAFAVDREWIDISPAQRLPLPAKSEDRARTLDAAEIALVWKALSEPHLGVGEGVKLALKLSLVTGQRIGACALARESDLDLDGQDDPELADSGPRWLIRGEPGVKAKSDRFLPLSPLAVGLLRQALLLPGRLPGSYVFRGKTLDAALTQQSISRAWGTLRRAGKVPGDTRPHDLRRSSRTWWPELAHGQEEHVLERILGHVVGTKTKRTYDRALWLPQQRKVLESWGRKLATITEGGAEVVAMRRGVPSRCRPVNRQSPTPQTTDYKADRWQQYRQQMLLHALPMHRLAIEGRDDFAVDGILRQDSIELHSCIVATFLVPDPVDREFRAWLADGVRRNRIRAMAQTLAVEGHESASLFGLIAAHSPYSHPADASIIRKILHSRRRDLDVAAHITAVLLIAAEVDPTRATLRLAIDSWRRLNQRKSLEERRRRLSLRKSLRGT